MNTNDRINALVEENVRLKERLSVAENERDEALAKLLTIELIANFPPKDKAVLKLLADNAVLVGFKRREQVKGAELMKNETIKSVSIAFMPHLEGVCAVVIRRIESGEVAV